jgi:nicotinamidase-related amidase
MGDLKAELGPASVHLCIDMQRLFAEEGPWPTPWMPRVLPAVSALAQHAAARTVFTRFMPPARATDAPGRWRSYYEKWSIVTRERIDPALLDLLPELARFAPPGMVIDKPAYSAFSAPQLRSRLDAMGADTLILTGSETDVCVLASALGAIDLGYRVVIARDGVCSSSDAQHDALIDLYAKRFDVQLELAAVAEIIDAWRP